jgi:short-subunit dehydrogenase
LYIHSQLFVITNSINCITVTIAFKKEAEGKIMPESVRNQVVVITGASSGIGRATALKFGKAGAKVVLAARNEIALHEVARQVEEAGGQALAVQTDVAHWEQVKRLADTAVETFDRIDTWVNNAGVGIYATAEETSPEEAQQLMQINFMGVVHGVTAALPYMKRQGNGTIINVGSVESMRALPYHSVYSASKHAVKGYTEALRMELEREKSGIHVTLVMPAGINTPFFNHARSKLGYKPMPAPPAYSPELVASAIVSAAQHPQRDIYVGGASFLFGFLERLNPTLTDKMMTTGGAMFRLQRTNEPDNGLDILYEPSIGTGRIEGDFGHITKPSMYTPIFELMPKWLSSAISVGVPLALGIALVSRQQSES